MRISEHYSFAFATSSQRAEARQMLVKHLTSATGGKMHNSQFVFTDTTNIVVTVTEGTGGPAEEDYWMISLEISALTMPIVDYEYNLRRDRVSRIVDNIDTVQWHKSITIAGKAIRDLMKSIEELLGTNIARIG